MSRILFSIFLIFLYTHSANAIDTSKRLERFTFASCSRPSHPQPLWEVMLEKNPQFYMWIGDSIYADTTDMEKMASLYQDQLDLPEYQKLLAKVPVTGVWDDHDFGENDAGKEYPKKRESQKLFLDFIGEPANSARREQEGLYTSYTFGPEGQKVKLIILDTRYFRDQPGKKKSDVLGTSQWNWLRAELKNSNAQIHMIVSSYSVLFFKNSFGEQWRSFKKGWKRLKKAIKKYDPPGLVFLTGDRHFSGIWSDEIHGKTYYELMASGFTKKIKKKSQRRLARRLYGKGNAITSRNFGMVDIDWEASPLRLTFHAVVKSGKSRLRKKFDLVDNIFVEVKK